MHPVRQEKAIEFHLPEAQCVSWQMNSNSLATISGFRIRTVNAPLQKPHKTASGTIEAAPLVLLDIETDAGVEGSSYVFVDTPLALRPLATLLGNLEDLVRGNVLEPSSITAALAARFRLLGNQGLTGIAVAAIDMALWDAFARLANMPLARLLGGAPKPLAVYDSLGQMDPQETAHEVEASLRRGFRAFKVKAGHRDPGTDVEVIRAIRNVAGDDAWVAADFNQAFSAAESISRMRLLDEENLVWIEEPVRAEDFAGHDNVRAAIRTPVQTGENWWGIADMTKSIAAGASDFAMPDVMKIGGVTGWMKAASLAEAHGLPVSSHLFVEVSCHLLAATPGAHILEWLDVAGSINKTPPTISEGTVNAPDIAGSGLNWNEKAIAQYEI